MNGWTGGLVLEEYMILKWEATHTAVGRLRDVWTSVFSVLAGQFLLLLPFGDDGANFC